MLFKSALRLMPSWRWPREIAGAPSLPFSFDLGAAVFTSGMAKRAGSVFAAAPIVQGSWASATPDAVTFPRGDLLGNQAQEWYANLDPYQGSIDIRIIPEWDGDDGKSHYFIAGSMGMIFGISLYKNSSDELVLQSDSTELVAVDVSAWVAGTIYYVVASWDTRNPIDGTNYARLSINNVHTYGYTAAFTPTTNPAIRVGSAFTAGIVTSPANAILDGPHIYRRVLWDGAYGVDVGNGDEVAAAAAGVDLCSATGSWDVPFCLPTDATPGALVTGPGETWSHPHGSALPTHAFCDDGGYMSELWAVLFDGATTVGDCGNDVTLRDIPAGGGIVQGECWFRCDALTGTDVLMSKGGGGITGWGLLVNSDGTVRGSVDLATADCNADGPAARTVKDGKWHHAVFSYNDTTKSCQTAVDGGWGAASVGVGAYVSDAAVNLFLGQLTTGGWLFEGTIGWARIWGAAHYTPGTDFVPPHIWPGIGAAVEGWRMNEGVGAASVAQVTAPNNDCALVNHVWERQWEVEATPVMPQSIVPLSLLALINFGSGVNIDDVPAGAFTFEGYFRFSEETMDSIRYLAAKGVWGTRGWGLRTTTSEQLRINIEYDTTPIEYTFAGFVYRPGIFHHIRVTYDQGGDRRARLYVDGIFQDASPASVGNYQSEAADNLYMLNHSGGNLGLEGSAAGWSRLSNNIRNAINFTPPDRQNPPANDANAQLLINMDDGAGTTALDTSGNNYDGTITAGRWDNTYDQTLDSPGVGPFQNGYVIGADGVGDGIGHLADVVAETDYVVRAILAPGQDSRGEWYVRVWDDIGGAWINVAYAMPKYHGAHTGGAVSPTLDDNTARWPQSLIGAIAYNITQSTSGAITAVNGNMQSLTAGINWNLNDEYRIFWADGYHNHPWCEPMVIRTPAACTRIDVRVLSADGEGTLYAHQVEVQESLIDNGSMEGIFAGVPPIPPLWVNHGLDAGDSQAASTGAGLIHAGAEALQFNAGAASEGMRQQPATVIGQFYCMGFWQVGDGAGQRNRLRLDSGLEGLLQYSDTIIFIAGAAAAVWSHAVGVWRMLRVNPRPEVEARAGAVAVRTIDDAYMFALDDVTLTVTPASEADCQESGGVRVVGRATCVQAVVPAALLQATQGWIRWRKRFRHAAANLDDFGEVPGSDYLMRAWGNATNYVDVFVTAANNIRLEFNDGAGAHLVNWNCAGLIAADVEHLLEVRWVAPRMELVFDGAVVATIVQPPNFAVVPTVVYWGSRNAGDRQVDAVFINP